jgi:hypothetical protein
MKKIIIVLALIFLLCNSCDFKCESKEDVIYDLILVEQSNYVRYMSLYFENFNNAKREIYFDSLKMSFYSLDMLQYELKK